MQGEGFHKDTLINTVAQPPTGSTAATFPMSSSPMPDGLWLMPEGASTELVPHTWPMNLGHGEWLEEMATKHGLTVDSALRQLIFVANGEAADIKRVRFARWPNRSFFLSGA